MDGRRVRRRLSTTIRISRLASIYAVEHGFEVQNRHPEATYPTLSGSDGFGFIAAQQAPHAQVSSMLDEAGMTEVDAWTLGEPVVRLLRTRWYTATCTPAVGRVLCENLFELLDP